MRHIYSRLLLCAVISLLSLTANAAEYCTVDGIRYWLYGNEAVVTSGGAYSGNIVIPESFTYNGMNYYVAYIDNQAFWGCTGLTSITIPNSVTHIGDYAFYNCGLTSVTIPDSVTSIGAAPFCGCINLETISVAGSNEYYDSRDNCNAIISKSDNQLIQGCNNTIIPNSVTSIEYCAFYNCIGLTSVTIPNSVTRIGDGAFYGCTGLTSITIPNNVTSIGDSAFEGCIGLTSITIGNSVTSIGHDAFKGCTGLTSVTLNCPNVGNWFKGLTSLIEVKFGNSVTSIEQSAFEGTTWYNNQPDGLVYAGKVAYKYKGTMPNDTKITLKEGTLGITAYAFEGCTGLTSITIPNSLINIGKGVFWGCCCLETIKVESGNPVYDSNGECNAIIHRGDTIGGDGMVIICNTLVAGCKNTVIHDDVDIIGEYAFAGCTGLTSFTLPRQILRVEDHAFDGCDNMKTLTILNVCNGDYDFSGCTNLRIIYSHIRFPDAYLHYDRFGSIFSDGIYLSEETYQNALLYIPMGTRSRYSCQENWNHFSNIIDTNYNDYCVVNGIYYDLIDETHEAMVAPYQRETLSQYMQNVVIPAKIGFNDTEYNVTSIAPGSFIRCYYLNSVTIPNSVTDIGKGAFEMCEYLVSVTIQNGVKNIDDMAFNGCKSLTSLSIPNSVKSIGALAFYECESLSQLTIPSSVTNIGIDAFYDCKGLMSLKLSEGLTNLGGWAFSGCIGLTTVNIPSSVKEIGEAPFEGCYNLESITVASGNKYYDSRGNCNAIIRKSDNMLIQGCETTIIPNNVTGIGLYAFGGCKWLKSIHIPNSIKSIGDYAFDECNNLKEVYSHITVPFEIDRWWRFPYDEATLYVPKGTSDLYRNTKYWNNFSNIVEIDYGETGIAPTVIDENDTPAEYYSIDGTRLDRPQRGINIIRMSDGTTRKVVVK